MTFNTVPNQTPTFPRHPKLAFVGECPAEREMIEGKPFVGPSGFLLWESLKEIGLSRLGVFIGNVCQHRAPKDNIKLLKWEHPWIQEGITQLKADLAKYDPDIVICLGGSALRAATGEKLSIESFKGTLFESDLLTPRRVKHLVMFHPAAVLHNDGYRFFWRNQLNRLEEEMQSPALSLPHRDIRIHTNFWEIRDLLRSLHGQRLAWDIEGYARTGVTCMSFSPSPSVAHVIPFRSKSPLHTCENEAHIWEEFSALLDSYHLNEPYHALTKSYICTEDRTSLDLPTTSLPEHKSRPGLLTWNGLYDAFVLAYHHNINPVHCIVDDGMILHWELFAEVDKGLGDAVSWLTKEPFYKSERESEDEETYWRYNGKDTCLTFECVDRLLEREELTPPSLSHYWFNLSLLPAVLYMELRGIRFDDSARRSLLGRTHQQIAALQGVLNRLVGMPYPASGAELKKLVVESMCMKKPRSKTVVKKVLKSGPRKGQEVDKVVSTPVEIETLHQACQYALSPHVEALHSLRVLLEGDWDHIGGLGALKRAQASVLLDLHFNIQSPAANEYLYNTLGLPPQYKKENGRLTDRLTHDQDAILTLYMKARKDPKFAHAEKALRVWLLLSRALTATETLVKGPDSDGRMRCSYNLVGSKTGRFSCSESAAQVGYNLQTVTQSHRSMYLADPGHYLGQFDLKGADGWTVACNCAALGDPTMLEDFAAKIKPAQTVVLLMERGEGVNALPREEVSRLCAKLPKDWRYKAAKREIWGTCYLMGIVTMGEQITQDAYKEDGEFLVIPAKDCRRIQDATLARYKGIPDWQGVIKEAVLRDACILAASGHVRRFFGRRWEWKEDSVTGQKRLEINRTVWGDALADLPQEHTTFATKLALWRLWYDPENRVDYTGPGPVLGFSHFRIEPLHTVHDSLVDQWQKGDTDFAKRKHQEWFNNPLRIAGIDITIPVDGEYSPNWSMEGASKL